ncbi:MAG TPA: DNA starvation/stationary phase protection protein [Prosthecobacter sp.]
MKTNIGIPDKNREKVAALLAPLLADEYVLQAKTRNAHWNVVGPDFHAMHLFFEEQYTKLAEVIDEIAERIRMLGGTAPGSLGAFLKLTHLKELDSKLSHSAPFVKALLADHETIIREMRDAAEICQKVEDEGTNDFIIGLIQEHEKTAWMLRATLA